MKSNFNKTMFMLLLLLLSVQAKAVVCLSPMAGNYTIDHTMVTGGTNFQTFTEAVAALTDCGVSGAVTFTVAPGTYYEQVIIGAVPGASAVNTITFDGVDRETRTITFNQTPTARYTIRLSGAEYVTIKNLTIDAGTGLIRWAMHITGGSENIVLDGNKIQSSLPPYSNSAFTGVSGNYAGIIASATPTGFATQGINVNHLEIKNNLIVGGATGISITSKSDALAEGILVQNNTFLDHTNRMISINFARSPQVFNNTFKGTDDLNYFFNLPGVITISGSEDGALISNNKIQTIGVYGIRIFNSNGSPSNYIKLYNNSIANMAVSSTATSAGIEIINSSFTQIWFNSVDMNFGFMKPILVNDLSSEVEIKNNTFSQRGGSIAYTTAAIEIQNLNSISAIDYNNYFVNTPYIAKVEGTMYPTFNDYKTLMAANSFDVNSISKDPQFYDLKELKPFGPNLMSAGTPITAVTTDLAGVSRNSTAPSIGSYEVTPLANDLGVSAIISPENKDFGKDVHEIKVRVTNYGSNIQSNIPVTVDISGDINGSVSGFIPGPLAWGESAEGVIGNFNLTAGGSIEISAATTLASDEQLDNNSISENYYIHPKITPPTVSDIVVCEGTTGEILASGTDKYNWYDSYNSNNIISTVNPFTTPVLNETADFFVEGIIESAEVLPNTTWSITSCNAQVYEFAAGAGHDITINSIDISFNFYSTFNPASNVVKITVINKPYNELTQEDYLNSSTLLTITPLQSQVSNNPATSPLVNVPLPDLFIPAGGAISIIMEGNYRVLVQSEPIEDNFLKVTPMEGYCAGYSLASMRGNINYTATSNPTEKVMATAIVPTVEAGDNQVAYLGYVPMECVTLTATGTFINDPLSTIIWSNGASGASISVCPTQTTTYTVTVTDQYGCTYTDDITVCVVDVRCQNGKVSMCKNPGNSGNWVNICVAPSAVEGQLQSGAMLGACGTQTDCGNVAAKRTLVSNSSANLELSLYPNPTSGMVNITVDIDSDEVMDIQLFTITGQLQKVIYSGSITGESTKHISFDASDIAQGTYLVRVSTATSVKQMKIFIAK